MSYRTYRGIEPEPTVVSRIAFHEKPWYDFKDETRYPARAVTGRVAIPFVGYCQAITGRALFFEPYS